MMVVAVMVMVVVVVIMKIFLLRRDLIIQSRQAKNE